MCMSICRLLVFVVFFFFFNDTATTEIYTLSLHDALPIYRVIPYRALACRACDLGFHIVSFLGHHEN